MYIFFKQGSRIRPLSNKLKCQGEFKVDDGSLNFTDFIPIKDERKTKDYVGKHPDHIYPDHI